MKKTVKHLSRGSSTKSRTAATLERGRKKRKGQLADALRDSREIRKLYGPALSAVNDFVKSKRKPKLKPDMIDLLRELYSEMYQHTESFEEHLIGADVAYLMGAVVSENCCIWPSDRPLVKLLHEHFPKEHEIWKYVAVVDGDD